MNYCIRDLDKIIFIAKNKDNISEIIVDYVDLDSAIKIIQEHKDKRVIFSIERFLGRGDMVADLKLLAETYNNIVFRCENYEELRALHDRDIPCFANYKLIFVDTFDKLVLYCKSGLTDLYITGELCFKTKLVREIANNYGVKLRFFPNVVQHSGFFDVDDMPSIAGFWVRPGDIHLYDEYFDVAEFMCPNDMQETFYDIYTTDYSGDLSLAVIGMDKMSNTSLSQKFTEFRINCGKRCFEDKCHHCYKFEALSKLVEENSLEVNESL